MSDEKPDTSIIFEPLKFRSFEVKNRIFRSNIAGRFDNEDGSGSQTRINWEERFAAGGVGMIISSFVPVTIHGRIAAGFATVDCDERIPFWAKVGETVHRHGAKYVMQLSHSGRQQDLPGVLNQHRKALSSTSKPETLHGFLCEAMTLEQIDETVEAFALGAWRAREAGLDGVELHAANGYLITQFLSSGINDRKDHYGGALENRARFLLEIVRAIRSKVGKEFHLQVKISAVDHNNLLPWEKKGNTLEESVQICKWLEEEDIDALHVSVGSLFPHPLNPPGDFHFETIAATYDAMISAGTHTFRNYLLFRYPLLRPIFRWLWFRMRKGLPVEGISADEARTIKQNVSLPVISTGGYQDAGTIARYLREGWFDAVSMARALVANPDLVRQFEGGNLMPERPCTHCNKCLLNAVKNPTGCYELSRYGGDYDAMMKEVMSIYDPPPDYRVDGREVAQ